MTKRIYRATVELYVYAGNLMEAKFKAVNASTTHVEWDVEEIDDISEIPDCWHDAIPWGEENNLSRTVQEILDEET